MKVSSDLFNVASSLRYVRGSYGHLACVILLSLSFFCEELFFLLKKLDWLLVLFELLWV